VLVSAPVNRKTLRAQLVKRLGWHAALWLLAWAIAGPRAIFGAEAYYVVRRGDTLFSIARHYSLAPSQLAERNGLSGSYHVYVGQRLLIPGLTKHRAPAPAETPPPPPPAAGSLPRSVQRAITEADVRPGRWKYIVIHHSGVDTGTVKSMDHYHRDVKHMENGLAYHFVIGNGSGMGDGQIAVCPRWTEQLNGGHLASEWQNTLALGICLVGNFDQHPPHPAQLESLHALIDALLSRCKLPPGAVKTHQQINIVRTRCPGSRFPAQSFLDSLKSPNNGSGGRK
jgi:hypothetical protein